MDDGIPESTAIGMLVIVIAMVIGIFIGAFLISSYWLISSSAKRPICWNVE